ncbi:hypothetical protein FJY63_00835 [Candidatus Sumerlaeota bacterium]|nr:hypothetical protein [Candidatus Sumerlaeota bacterium]
MATVSTTTRDTRHTGLRSPVSAFRTHGIRPAKALVGCRTAAIEQIGASTSPAAAIIRVSGCGSVPLLSLASKSPRPVEAQVAA